MATYAIGDIQGCYQSLRKLLNKISFNPNSDRLLLAGDMINRGPKSLATMHFILEYQDCIQAVLGNHDLHFLAVANHCQVIQPKDTFDDILSSELNSAIVDWLTQCPLVHYIDEFDSLMIHAGLPYYWSKTEALNYSNEVSETLNSSKANNFFKSMYGNKPDSWSNSLESNDRLRFITNAFTRMRYCYPNGRLELTNKKPPTNDCTDSHGQTIVPWFQLTNSHFKGSVLFGHWASLQGSSSNSKTIALDTGCVWGGQLTAYRLEDQSFFRVDASNG